MSLSQSLSLAAIVEEGARQLEVAGVPAADSVREAALLARAVLGWDQARWLVRRQDAASPEFIAAFAPVLARRAAREPIAYILGEREFYGRPFIVSPAVLVPRPETELVIERAREWLSSRTDTGAALIVDIGTGSGCLAVTLALESPGTHVVATDVDAGALEIAAANAARHGVATRIDFRHAPLAADIAGLADLVVANPPYVPARDRSSLPPDVRDYEPAEALYGGTDGLDVIRQLAPAAFGALRPGGGLIMEIGAGQWETVERLVSGAGFHGVQAHPDLAGIPRVVVAERP